MGITLKTKPKKVPDSTKNNGKTNDLANLPATEPTKVTPKVPKVKVVKATKTAEELQAEADAQAKMDARLNIPKPERDDYTKGELDAIMKEEGLPTGDAYPDSDDQIEFRRKQILRLMLRGVPRITIRQYLNMNADMLAHEIACIKKQVAKDVTHMDVPQFVGMTMQFYDEARSIALRLATDTNEKSNLVKMRALEVALKAEGDRHAYLQRIGLYKTPVPVNLGTPAEHTSNDAEDLLMLLESVVSTNGGTIDIDTTYSDIGLR